MSGKLVSRNVTIAGRRTSLRLEENMWDALGEICSREDASIHEMCSEVDRRRNCSNRTSAVRAFIVRYFRSAATESGHSRAGHGSTASKRRNDDSSKFEGLFPTS